jgi:protein-S-isoprenylcysteine O-methyltransferase Ste14
MVLSLLTGMVVFAGLPLVTWGLADVPGFFSQTARLAYVVAAVLLQLAVVVLPPDTLGLRASGQMARRGRRSALALLQILSLLLVLVAPFCDRRGIAVLPESPAVRLAGLGLFTSGFLLMHWAAARLGKQFNVEISLHKDHRLITDGPYKYLRHPRYFGIIVFATGLALVFRSLLALVVTAGIFLVLRRRIRKEESLLQERFQDQWKDYARRTWRLIPFVY